MPLNDQLIAIPAEAVRRLVIDRRTVAQAAVAELIASLAPRSVADTWQSLGDMADTIVGRLARRSGRARA